MTLDDLIAYGADVKTGMARCLDNESFYLRLVDSVKQDANFEKLEKAIEENNLDDAFDAAHALKGSLGNLSLTPLYEPICEITELLRSRTEMDYTDLMNVITQQKERLFAL